MQVYRAVTKISSCQAYEISRQGTEQRRCKQLVGVKILDCRDPQMPFPASPCIFPLQMQLTFSFRAFSRVSEMHFNSVNFTFLLLLFFF